MHWRIQGAHPASPQRTQFFRFDIHILRNVAASGVHAPPTRSTPPPTGNPGSATEMRKLYKKYVAVFSQKLIQYDVKYATTRLPLHVENLW